METEEVSASSSTLYYLRLWRFWGTIYYLFSITGRVCFLSYSFRDDFGLIIFLDYLMDAFFLMDAFLKEGIQKSQPIHKFIRRVTSINMLQSKISPTPRKTVASIIPSAKATHKNMRYISQAYELFSAIPFEAILYCFGVKHYYLFRMTKLLRIIFVRHYWDDLSISLEELNILRSASGHRAMFYLMSMFCVGHVGGCIMYLISYLQMTSENPLAYTMLMQSRQASYQYSDDGNIIGVEFVHPKIYRYIYALYYSVNVAETVGFGDIVPITTAEMWWTLCIGFVGFIVVQFTVSNFIVLINGNDAARTKYIKQVDQLVKYASLKHMSRPLEQKIHAFYEHQFHVLKGLNEKELLRELPSSIQIRILHLTVREYLTNITTLKELGTAVLNALTERVKEVMYTPNDVIVTVSSVAKGMYIITRGEVIITNGSHSTIQGNNLAQVSPAATEEDIVISMKETDSFGEAALFHSFNYSYNAHSGNVITELLFLSRAHFKKVCKQYLNQTDCEYLFAQHERVVNRGETRKRGSSIHDIDDDDDEDEFNRPVQRLSKNDGKLSTKNLSEKDRRAPSKSRLIEAPSLKNESNKDWKENIDCDTVVVSRNRKRVSAGITVHVNKTERINPHFKPGSQFRKLWNISLFFGLLFYVTSNALILADMFAPNFFQLHKGKILFSFTFDVMFLIDHYLRAREFYYISDGICILEKDKIYEHYLKHENIVLSIITAIPYDFICFAYGVKFFPITRLIKLLRLRKLSQFGGLVETFVRDYTGFILSFEMRRVVIMYFALFQVAHWAGCIFQFTADLSTHVFDMDVNWKMQDRDNPILSIGGGSNDQLYGEKIYRRSIYWAMNTMTSNGTGDMPSTNVYEVAACTVIMLIGCPIIVTLIGNIASLMSNLDADKKNFQNKLNRVNKLFKLKKIPKSLQDQILSFYEFDWSRKSGVDEVELLSNLSQSLKESVIKDISGKLLLNIPFFRHLDDYVLEFILGLLVTRLFVQNDCVITEGEYGKEAFFIRSGLIEVTSHDRQIVFAVLATGEYIGESSLLRISKRTASAYAKDYTETYVLSKVEFNKLNDAYPEAYASILSVINDILEAKKSKNNVKRKESMMIQSGQSLLGDRKQSVLGRKQSSSQVVPAVTNRSFNPQSIVSRSESFSFHTTKSPGIANAGLMPFPNSKKKIADMSDTDKDSVVSPSEADADSQSSDEDDSSSSAKHAPIDSELVLYLRHIFDLDTFARSLWDTCILFIMFYFIIFVPLRFVYPQNPYGFFLDYIFDGILLIDMYFNYSVFKIKKVGGKIVSKTKTLKDIYLKGDYKRDLITRLPYDLFALFFIRSSKLYMAMCALRVPKLILVMHGPYLMKQLEFITSKLKIPLFYIKTIQLVAGCLIIGHWLACGLLVFSLLNYPTGCTPVANAVTGTFLYGQACEFEDTWVQFQIMISRLDQYGSSNLKRYLTAMEWAVPTLTLFVLGDVYPVTEPESTYVFITLFLGVALQGYHIGSLLALLGEDENVTLIQEKKDILLKNLAKNNIDQKVIQKVSDYMSFKMNDDVQLLAMESIILSEVPFSLQVAYIEVTRLQYLRKCPFFDFCSDDIIKNLALSMNLEIYNAFDNICIHGDIGCEMYFIEDGKVEVSSEDYKTIYSTLGPGDFFGEAGLVSRIVRSANIRALTICKCYVLHKEYLDNELKFCDYEVDITTKSLEKLQKSNMWRNSALKSNLSLVENKETKLSKIIGELQRDILSPFTRMVLSHDSLFRASLDIGGLCILMYYMTIVPFQFAFIYTDNFKYYTLHLIFNALIDFLAILELSIRIYILYQSVALTSVNNLIFFHYSDTLYNSMNAALVIDILGSIPIDYFVLVDGYVISIYIYRLIRFIKVANIFTRLSQVQIHIYRLGFKMNKNKLQVCKLVVAYLIVFHLFACIYFSNHRYVLRHTKYTFLTKYGDSAFDDELGKHDICSSTVSRCYLVSIYLIVTTMTSVGFGDIFPMAGSELVLQVFLSILSACMAPMLCSEIGNMEKSIEKVGNQPFKNKIQNVLTYVQHKKLDSDLSDILLVHFEYQWYKEFSLGGRKESILGYLSKPLSEEVSYHMCQGVIQKVPLISDSKYMIQCKIALELRPQLQLANSMVYNENDPAHNAYFVASGMINVSIPSDVNMDELEYFDFLSCLLLKSKHKASANHSVGMHFGEFCFTAEAALRLENAYAVSFSELYQIEDKNLWKVLLHLNFRDRINFMLRLFSTNRSATHTRPESDSRHIDENIKQPMNISNFYKINTSLVEELAQQYLDETEKNKHDHRKRRMSYASVNSEDGKEGVLCKIIWLRALGTFFEFDTRDTALGNFNNTFLNVSIAKRGYVASKLYSFVGTLTEMQLKHIRSLIHSMFYTIDDNGSGLIDHYELFEGLSKFGMNLSLEDVEELISYTDTCDNQKIDPEEMEACVLQELAYIHERHLPLFELFMNYAKLSFSKNDRSDNDSSKESDFENTSESDRAQEEASEVKRDEDITKILKDEDKEDSESLDESEAERQMFLEASMAELFGSDNFDTEDENENNFWESASANVNNNDRMSNNHLAAITSPTASASRGKEYDEKSEGDDDDNDDNTSDGLVNEVRPTNQTC